MVASSLFAAVVSLFALGASAAPKALQPRQSGADLIGLYIDTTAFDTTYLQTSHVSYANTSAYIGQIKYQSYAEPLVVSAFTATDSSSNGVSFLSIHQSPTGFQNMYIIPEETQPVGFSVPHGSAPQGVSTTRFSFGADGALLHEGVNNFYACQNAEQAAMNSFQIWWFGAGQPNGVGCKGPVRIVAGDACART
ncbi:hypothetical protein A1O7_01675 [Cladophialophora yegresii CBS 114405]|uniref:Ubiquitin 3 binding protein But2 C-terminal domain-containing protein n=1 Tax=Cladophialophora yegresii CBS 114405 TaxID=1182544 RepID=W9X4H1_9EURO|nr:uncharacterized protein A1O7_01675 [Cladophialophora yegresii CBS 114405]EXJ65334.1 hypothetical protein A1O7_01675 [Cladophialophora yegresii CBS 114405]